MLHIWLFHWRSSCLWVRIYCFLIEIIRSHTCLPICTRCWAWVFCFPVPAQKISNTLISLLYYCVLSSIWIRWTRLGVVPTASMPRRIQDLIISDLFLSIWKAVLPINSASDSLVLNVIVTSFAAISVSSGINDTLLLYWGFLGLGLYEYPGYWSFSIL